MEINWSYATMMLASMLMLGSAICHFIALADPLLDVGALPPSPPVNKSGLVWLKGYFVPPDGDAPMAPPTSPPVTPSLACVSGLPRLLHVDASSGVSLDANGSVVAWVDRSGEGNDLTVPSDCVAPRLVRDAASARETLEFDGACLAAPSRILSGSNASGMEVWVAAARASSPDVSNADTPIFECGNATTEGYGMALDVGGGTVHTPTAHGGAVASFLLNNSDSLGVYRIRVTFGGGGRMTLERDRHVAVDASTTLVDLRVSSVGGGDSPFNSGQFTVGASSVRSTPPTTGVRAIVGELLVVDAWLDAVGTACVHDHLHSRWSTGD